MNKKYQKILLFAIAGLLGVTVIYGCNQTQKTTSEAGDNTTNEAISDNMSTEPAPERVVALNSTTVEIIDALGKEATIIGADRSAHMLEKKLPESVAELGHPYTPNIEAIISLKPDLILGTQDSFQNEIEEQIKSTGIRTVVLEKSDKDGMDGLYRRITEIAKIYNEPANGEVLIADLKNQIQELEKKTSILTTRPKVLFLYAHGTGNANILGSKTGTGILISLAGGDNVATFEYGNQPLTAEAIAQAAPDAIVLLKRGLKAAGGIEGVLKLPGVNLTPAGKNKKVIMVDNSVRWIGPNFPQYATQLFNELQEKPNPQ